MVLGRFDRMTQGTRGLDAETARGTPSGETYFELLDEEHGQ